MLEATLGIEPRIGVLQTPALPLGYVARKRQLSDQGYRERCLAANTPGLGAVGSRLANRSALNDAPPMIGVACQEEPDVLTNRPALEGFAV